MSELPAGWNTGSSEQSAAVVAAEIALEGGSTLHRTFNRCIQELVRQVSIHCMEQGQLLAFIWGTYVQSLRLREDELLAQLDAARQALADR